MAKHISQLLGTGEQTAANIVAKLEKLAGFPSQDNRLLSDIKSNLRTKVAELGLDPNDTTPKELYYTVLSHFEVDSRNFDALIGGALKNMIHLAQICDIPRQAWVLKRSVAKELLRLHPPKRLARALNYRSTESMLKREDIEVLYTALPYVESQSWLKSFYRSHGDLQPFDFEIRDISIIVMPENKMRFKSNTAVSYFPCIGAVAIWPDCCNRFSTLLGVYISCLEAVEEVRLNQLTVMAAQVRADFGRQVVMSLEGIPKTVAKVAGYPVKWRTLHHYFGHLPRAIHPMLREIHMHEASVHKLSYTKALASLHPIFRWWHTSEHTAALSSGEPVSLNLADAAINHHKKYSYQNRQSSCIKHSLTDELFSRYMRYPGVESFILKQMDRQFEEAKPLSREQLFSIPAKKELQLA